MFKDKTTIEIDGHVLIKDPETDEILLDQHNACLLYTSDAADE